MTGNIFTIYIENMLLPVLNLGDIVVIDNLSVHKSVNVEEAIYHANTDL